MTERPDIRWQQRFSNYQSALVLLEAAIVMLPQTVGEELIKIEEATATQMLMYEGLVQRFEYTYEMAWKTLQDLLHEKGFVDVRGPNDVFVAALANGFIQDRPVWIEIRKARNISSHTYDQKIVPKMTHDISNVFILAFRALEERLVLEQNAKQDE
jgi:nucleotidyltransferase substrate binding protein (TIGR01987 family)